MRRIAFEPLAFAALVAAATAGVAQADTFDRLKLRLNGQASVVGAYVDQSNLDGLDQGVFAVDSNLFGSASLPLDGGDEIGARVAFGVDYASNFDAMLNDAGSKNLMDEFWLYWEGRFGRVQIGLDDGAARIMGLRPPSVTQSLRVDNPEIFLLGFPCNNNCSSDPQAPGSLFSPNGMQLRSDIHSSDDYIKITYTTPSFGGLRLAASFAPDGTRDPGQLFGADEVNEQGDIWDFAANYLTTFGAVDLGLSAGYVTGTNVNKVGFRAGDLEDWGGAARLGYREWTLGGAFRRTNVAGAGPIVAGFNYNVIDGLYTDVWSAGLTYETGPWMFGANYIYADEELLFSSVNQQGSGLQFAGGYTFNENIKLTAGYQRFAFDGPSNFCFDFGGSSCDTLDGSLGYLETTFSF